MHIYFKILLNKLDTLNYQNLLPEEIDIFLNQAMFKFIENRAYGLNPKGDSLEETQKRVDDLRNIIFSVTTTSTSFTTTAENKPNGLFVPLPSDYRHAIEEECTISYTDCNGVTRTKRVEVVPITHDRYNRIKKDPFNKPYEDLILRLGYASTGTTADAAAGNSSPSFELLTDGTYTITTYYLRYIATPIEMRNGAEYSTPTTNQGCVLSDHTHRELVELATQAAIETIESPRIQTYPSIVKTTE